MIKVMRRHDEPNNVLGTGEMLPGYYDTVADAIEGAKANFRSQHGAEANHAESSLTNVPSVKLLTITGGNHRAVYQMIIK